MASHRYSLKPTSREDLAKEKISREIINLKDDEGQAKRDVGAVRAALINSKFQKPVTSDQ